MEKNFNKRIIILVPLTIPSSGKSISFKRLLNNEQIQVELVSSDTCREQVMNQLKIKNPNMSHQDLFDKSGKDSKALFKKYTRDAFNRLESSKQQYCVLVLDKNHPSNALPSTVKDLNEIIGNRKNVKIVGLVPQCSTKFNLNGNQYPFSLQYLITCTIRAINRQSHETLLGDGAERAKVVLSFFNMFRGVKNNKQNLGKYFDGLLHLKMFNEEIPDVTAEIKDLVTLCLSHIKPGSFSDTPYTPSLVQKLSQIKINQIPIQTLLQQNFPKIKQLFDNFQNLEITQ